MTAPAPFGHNETTVRLGLLAEDARQGLARVAAGEADAIEGWLAYGAALNEGRALHAGDREFGQWLASLCFDKLSMQPNEHEQVAAMWAAANPDQFAEAREAGNARTVRGIHAKWKEIEAAREAEAERQRAEAARAEAAAKAEAEERARREAQGARDEEARRDAEERAARFREQRRDAEHRAREADANAARRDPAALRQSVLAAVEDARRPVDRRNPNHVPDAYRDAVLSFIDHCEQLAATGDLERIAAYDDPRFASTAARRDRCAQAALETLTRYMELRNA